MTLFNDSFVKRYELLRNLVMEACDSLRPAQLSKEEYLAEAGRLWEEQHSKAQGSDQKANNQFLLRLLEEVVNFGDEYRDYFGKQNDVTLPDLNTALARLQEEWSPISRACEQRRSIMLRGILKDTDQKALFYYRRFRGYKPSEDIGPITYIEKSFEITRYTFTPYPLISVPFLYLDQTTYRDQSIAHEMGHYIYWNSAPLSQYRNVQKALKLSVLSALNAATPELDFASFDGWTKLSERWAVWLEETFADVCGTLFGGVDFFQSACEISNGFSFEELIYDDNEHPVFYMRPLIAIETLKWMTNQSADYSDLLKSNSSISQLEQDWLDKIQAEVIDSKIIGINLDLKHIQRSIQTVVTAILEASVWTGKTSQPSQMGDGKEGAMQALTNLGSLILYEPDMSFANVRASQKPLKPFERLQMELRSHIQEIALENKINFNPELTELYLRKLLTELDLGDESPGLPGPKPKRPK